MSAEDFKSKQASQSTEEENKDSPIKSNTSSNADEKVEDKKSSESVPGQ